jgi:hypothetical protein
MITENPTDADFKSSMHLIYGKALLDFAKRAANEFIGAQGDRRALLRFIENSKIEVNGKIFPSKLLWGLLLDCYEPAPTQLKIKHCAALDFSDCRTYRDVCLRFEHSYFQVYHASQDTILIPEICA